MGRPPNSKNRDHDSDDHGHDDDNHDRRLRDKPFDPPHRGRDDEQSEAPPAPEPEPHSPAPPAPPIIPQEDDAAEVRRPGKSDDDDAPTLADQIRPGGPDEPAPAGEPGVVPTVAIPEVRKLNKNQTGMLGIEALEGYFYGQRTRVDHNGMTWDYRRESVDDQWQLAIRVTFAGAELAAAFVPLDKVASREGEHQVLAVVETLAEQARERVGELRRRQQAMRSEAEQAVEDARKAELEKQRADERNKAEARRDA
jgi:hypothetical protein